MPEQGGPTVTEEPRATPLVARHEALGARLVDFAGWRMPIQYAGILEEHRAVRQRAGLFDLCHMGELFVEGPEAGDALAGAVTTDPRTLAIGRAHYSMICAPDGGILDDLIVYRLADDRFLVVANASNAAVVSDALAERFEGRRAILDDRSLATALVAIQGPAALGILSRLTLLDLDAIRYYGIAEGVVAGVECLVARTGYTGEDGFEVFVDAASGTTIWDALTEAGQSAGLVPVGLGARDTLRLEAGMPLYGNELDRSTTPFEAGLGRVVKLAKDGGFVGRDEASEALAAGLDLVIHSPEQVAILEGLGGGDPVDLWLKVDSGMGRLGLEPAAVEPKPGDRKFLEANYPILKGAAQFLVELLVEEPQHRWLVTPFSIISAIPSCIPQ